MNHPLCTFSSALQCRYVDEYLAIGEAPEEVRNCFQQRSRWSKGHFQVRKAWQDFAESKLSRLAQQLRCSHVNAVLLHRAYPCLWQVFFSKHNPVLSRQLSWLMRWMYGSVILSYFSAFLATPLLMLVPMITVRSGLAKKAGTHAEQPASSCLVRLSAPECTWLKLRAPQHLRISLWHSALQEERGLVWGWAIAGGSP